MHPTAMPAPCPETIVAGQSPIVRKSPPAEVLNDQTCDVHFATTGAVGIVDLGASQTVIGAQQVKDLIGSLPPTCSKSDSKNIMQLDVSAWQSSNTHQ